VCSARSAPARAGRPACPRARLRNARKQTKNKRTRTTLSDNKVLTGYMEERVPCPWQRPAGSARRAPRRRKRRSERPKTNSSSWRNEIMMKHAKCLCHIQASEGNKSIWLLAVVSCRPFGARPHTQTHRPGRRQLIRLDPIGNLESIPLICCRCCCCRRCHCRPFVRLRRAPVSPACLFLAVLSRRPPAGRTEELVVKSLGAPAPRPGRAQR
jgi:hypothetical protein